MSVVFLVIAVLVGFVLAPRFNAVTRETTKVAMVNADVEPGEKITEDMVTTLEVGKYNLPSSVVKDPDALTNRYAIKQLYANRFVYKEDIVANEPKESVKYKIKNSGVTFKTDLAKCVGGIPKVGDYVNVYIVARGDDGREIKAVLNQELSAMQILDIQNSDGKQVTAETENSGGAFSSSSSAKDSIPAFVTVNTLNSKQEQLIVAGTYNGEVHLTLLNPDHVKKPNVSTSSAADAKATKNNLPAATQKPAEKKGGFDIR